MFRIVSVIGRDLSQEVHHVRERGRWHFCRRSVANSMGESCERQRVARAAALMIKPQRVRASKRRSDTLINKKGMGRAQTRHLQPIFTWRLELAEVGLEDFIVRWI